MEFDFSQLLNHGLTQEVLLAIIALFLKSAVKLLHQIHSVFIKIESALAKVATSNDAIIDKVDKVGDKVTALHGAYSLESRRHRKASPVSNAASS